MGMAYRGKENQGESSTGWPERLLWEAIWAESVKAEWELDMEEPRRWKFERGTS